MSTRLYVAANGMGPINKGSIVVAVLQRSNSLRTAIKIIYCRYLFSINGYTVPLPFTLYCNISYRRVHNDEPVLSSIEAHGALVSELSVAVLGSS